MTKHKAKKTIEYRTWLWMKGVCYNKRNPSYKTYGARSICMDDGWRRDFCTFLNEMGNAPDGSTGIELIDLSKDFCKYNCRWVNPNTRRPLKDMPNQKNRKRKGKRLKNPKLVAFKVDGDYYDFLQRQATEEARRKKIPISVSSLVRSVLYASAPMNIQSEMFES